MDNAPNEVPSWVHYPKEILKLLALNNFLWYDNFCVILLLCKKSKTNKKSSKNIETQKWKCGMLMRVLPPPLFLFWGNSQSLTFCFDIFFVPLCQQLKCFAEKNFYTVLLLMNIIVRFYFIFWTRENTSYISNLLTYLYIIN